MNKSVFYPVLFTVLLWAALAGCSRQADRPAVPTSTQTGGSSIAVVTVEVTQSAAVRVRGTASLPPGDCLQTGLWIDDQPAGWWPANVCIEPDAGEWEMVVALGKNDTPAQLDPQARYELRAWPEGQPDQVLLRHVFQIE